MLAAVFAVAPAAMAQTTAGGTSGTTLPLLPLPSPTTTAAPTAAPGPSPTTTAPAATAMPKPTSPTTVAKSGNGVPPVPVGGPPTTAAAPGAKPAPPAPPPDPSPILLQVDGDLAQLTAISDYKPAKTLVSQAQSRVTAAGATLLSARQNLDLAKALQAKAAQSKAVADEQLRQMAIAAYVGVGFTSPGLGQPAQGNGDQGAGTVSTPDGLTGMNAIDAKEMLLLVGQHAHENDTDASHAVSQAAKATAAADATYRKDQAAVGAAEAQLMAAQQTLKMVTTAALTPGAASATSLPDLLAAATTGRMPTTTTTVAPQSAQAAALPIANGAKPKSPAILGQPALDAKQLAAWWATLNRKPNITVPIEQLINSYAAWGAKLGVRYDVAFAQSIIETGYFSFPSYGQLTSKDNNFAGIGACDTCAHGWSFPTADTGVQAQLELLRKYATDAPLPAGVKDLIGTGIGGCCTTWTQLAGKWASSTVYGISIMTVYDKMLTWLIPQEEVSVGLIAPTSPDAKGPELAPLPPGAKQPAKPGTKPASPITVSPGISAAALHPGR